MKKSSFLHFLLIPALVVLFVLNLIPVQAEAPVLYPGGGYSVYAGRDDPHDTLSIAAVSGDSLLFDCFWYRIFSMDRVLAVRNETGEYEFAFNDGWDTIVGKLVFSGTSAYLIIESSTMSYIPQGLYIYDGTELPFPVIDAIPELPQQAFPIWLSDPRVERIRPQCGPGREYSVFASMNGSVKLYKPGDITYLEALFQTGDFVYLEFGYTDGVVRCGFFEKSLFTCPSGWMSVPEYALSFQKAGIVTVRTTPFNAPTWDAGSYSSCELAAGTDVYACMECDGWYLCRFYTSGNHYGYVYLWIPGSNISFI